MTSQVAMRRTPCSTPQPPRSLLDSIQENRRIWLALSGGCPVRISDLGAEALIRDEFPWR